MVTVTTIELANEHTDAAAPSPKGGKRILIAAPRGYCAGVDRAVDAVEQALDHYGAPIYVRKEIVHNKYVVETLSKRGAIFVSETDEVPVGARVVFSAHGVSPAVHEAAAARHLATIDATCPLVTKVHREAVRFAKEDYDIILVGHQGHEEVEGTFGEAPDHIQVVGTPDEVEGVVVRDPSRVVWISQTTLSVDETRETVDRLRQRFPQLIDPPSDDICYATQNRQGAVKHIAPQVDVMVVVGSANSSNSVRLVEVALEAGAGSAYRVDKADELEESWFEGAAPWVSPRGASVARSIRRRREVSHEVDWQASSGFPTVEVAAPKPSRRPSRCRATCAQTSRRPAWRPRVPTRPAWPGQTTRSRATPPGRSDRMGACLLLSVSLDCPTSASPPCSTH